MTDATAPRAPDELARLAASLDAEIRAYRLKQAEVDRRKQCRGWITIALLCCTALGAGAGSQIWEMIKAYRPIREQATAMTNTITSTRQQQRAVIDYRPGPVFKMNDKDNRQSFAFSVTFQNLGGTRTSKFHAWHSVQYFENGVPNSLDLTKPWGKIEAVTGLVASPNNPIVMQPLSVSAEESARALKKDGAILQWGYAEYADIFEPDKLHRLKFCYAMEPAPTPSGPGTGFQPVPFRNDCNGNE